MTSVGVVYNLKRESAEDDEPPDSCAEYDCESTVTAVADALRSYGYNVSLIEADETAYLKLLAHKPDIVFNMAEGLRGESRESHIPAILEMLNIPYTGSGVMALALTLNKPLSKQVLAYKGIPTPKFVVLDPASVCGDGPGVGGLDLQLLDGLSYPVFAKLACEGSSMGITSTSCCHDQEALFREVRRLSLMYRKPILVEEYLPGREFTVGIIGNTHPVVFPIMEINFDAVPEGHGRVYSRYFKDNLLEDKYYLCPAPMSPGLEAEIKELAFRTYRALGCRDFARVDLRLDRDGVPNVLEVNPLPGLAPGYSDYPRIAAKAGWSYTELINGILECALRRYGLEQLIARSPVHEIA
ncbi:MAG: D-alanine--D-alanine ligase [Firmicutes bacterium]|nr:D-alanine--D-alanine ligase [Candidatus Fermentithermobacillaceae bacterium]